MSYNHFENSCASFYFRPRWGNKEALNEYIVAEILGSKGTDCEEHFSKCRIDHLFNNFSNVTSKS